MDPNATLATILEALREKNRETAIIHLQALADWLDKGGFMPDPVPAP